MRDSERRAWNFSTHRELERIDCIERCAHLTLQTCIGAPYTHFWEGLADYGLCDVSASAPCV